jgi:glycosidase
VPSVYYGDEQAFRGVKEERAGGDDAVRPAFPAAPDGLAPHGWPVFHTHQELIGARRRNAWLTGARTRVDHVANEQLAFSSRSGDGVVTVLLNLADSEHRFDGTGAPGVLARSGESPDPWLLPPKSWAVLAPDVDSGGSRLS